VECTVAPSAPIEAVTRALQQQHPSLCCPDFHLVIAHTCTAPGAQVSDCGSCVFAVRSQARLPIPIVVEHTPATIVLRESSRVSALTDALEDGRGRGPWYVHCDGRLVAGGDVHLSTCARRGRSRSQ
jgi:hypothetical protein